MNKEQVRKRVTELFFIISDIPRPSYREEKIADLICDFAAKNGCEFYRDEANNVLVNVKATKGCEGRAPILLQGHTDMVCEKNEGTVHDFLSEGIKIVEKDGWLTADGTTLGADNGVAVAIMLYVIEGGIDEHGDVQCLFTSAEEVGLDGVKSFDFSRIFARKMINMDGENEKCVIVGCAGGLRTDVELEPSYKEISSDVLKIRISGLCGGHSGENIASGRANANILMGRLLCEIFYKVGLSVVSLSGGTKENAIPREATAYIEVDNRDKVKQIADEFYRGVKKELSAEDSGFALSCELSSEEFSRAFDKKSTRSVLTLLASVKNGIIEMSKSLSGLVEYSRNLGVIKFADGKLDLVFNSRSAIDAQLDAAERELELLAGLSGGKATHYSRYPGWAYSKESALADEYIDVCRELYGREVRKEMIHAGLECGIIKANLEGLDCISCGPNMKNLHSPEEALEVDSFGEYALAVCTLIKNSK